MAQFIILTILIVFITSENLVNAVEPINSISRDGYGRADPNAILNGFFPAWAIVLLCLSAVFAVIAVISFIGFQLGCRNPKKQQKLQKA